MNRLFILNLFFFCLFGVRAQIVETIPGEYTFREELGIHAYGPTGSFGNLSYCFPLTYTDTVVAHKLCLNENHGAFFERDTIINSFSRFPPRQEYLGDWSLSGDSLIVTFDHLLTFWPFNIPGSPSTVAEELPEPIVMSYSLGEIEGVIYWLYRKDDPGITFQREEMDC